MGTAIVLGILLIIVTGIIRSMVKRKKAGKSLACAGDCASCKGCH